MAKMPKLNPAQIRAIKNSPKGVLPAFINKAVTRTKNPATRASDTLSSTRGTYWGNTNKSKAKRTLHDATGL